jgi:[ribosomal protein S5]-alanine N-acetyltransferase
MKKRYAMKKYAEQVYLTGKKINLRPLCRSDINERYLSWLNDYEVTKYMETGIFPTTFAELKDFYDVMRNKRNSVLFAIVAKKKDLHIGNIKLGNINWIHRFADLGIMIGDKKFWGRGYGQEACDMLLEYAFRRLNLNKVTLGVCANHKSAVKAYKNVGFEIEGRIKKLLNFEGGYVDKVIMGVLKDKYVG